VTRITRALHCLPVAAAGLLAACGQTSGSEGQSGAAAAAEVGPAVKTSKSRLSTVATGLQVPWGITFLPGRGGDALVAERTTGRIIRIARPGGRKSVVQKIPGVDVNAGEGGLLGLTVSPDYVKDKLVYAYFTSGSDNRIVRFRLGGRPKVILSGLKAGSIHNGGRIAFGPDGKLYATVGETGDTGLAQDRTSQNGKILRMNADGSVPGDNPFRGSRVWSLGHRNPQGLAWDSKGRLWASEFGQNTFDEVNLIQKGHNYGWPTVEGRGSTRGGKFTNPKLTFRTSEASPSGDAIIANKLYIAGLGGQVLFRSTLKGTTAGKPVKLLAGKYGRLRTVIKAPDGSLWIATSNRDGRGEPRRGDDRIVRLR